MKQFILLSSLVLPLMLFINGKPKERIKPIPTEWADCLEKYKSAWGEPTTRCSGNDTYKVWLKNNCTESIDVLVCVQEDNKTWRPFSHNGMAPRDSMIAYACKGTGKYLYWARKSGDDTVVFPTVDEINKKYNE